MSTTRSFHTATRGETLVAFVSADGPQGARQAASVNGGGVRWVRVSQADALPGDAEIWVANAAGVLIGARVSATLAIPGYDELLSVIAVEGTDGAGAVQAGSAPAGAPSLTITTRAPASLVFAVGHDWDRAQARTLPPGWVPLDQWLNTGTGDSSWVQYTNAATAREHTIVDRARSRAHERPMELRRDRAAWR